MIDFKEKVQSMKVSEIVRAMTSGLRNKHVRIDMSTFGEIQGEVCFGCAATNAVAEVSGKSFTTDVIQFREDRAKFIGTDYRFLDLFEYAVNALRGGLLDEYNNYAEKGDFALIPEDFRTDNLPYLWSDFTEEDLQAYDRLADELSAAGY